MSKQSPSAEIAVGQEMRTPSLAGCFAKLKRAAEHIGMLRAHVERGTPPVTLAKETEFDAARQTMRVSAKIVELPTLPEAWSVLIGDVVQNIRAALDYFVYELIAVEADGVYWEESQFPIALQPEDHKSWREVGTIERLGRHWPVIQSYEPYAGADPPHLVDLAFWYLREFSNQDKHRLLVPASAALDANSALSILLPSSGLRRLGSSYFNVGVLEKDAVLAWEDFLIVGASPDVYLSEKYTPIVCFAEVPFVRVDELLDLIHQKALRLVGTFQSLF
jgi:hypothetical protein